MELLQDITIGEGEAVPPSTRFVKMWRLKNNGKLQTDVNFTQLLSIAHYIIYTVVNRDMIWKRRLGITISTN
jgi:hypothetical protein